MKKKYENERLVTYLRVTDSFIMCDVKIIVPRILTVILYFIFIVIGTVH
jgi:hypothetical protein